MCHDRYKPTAKGRERERQKKLFPVPTHNRKLKQTAGAVCVGTQQQLEYKSFRPKNLFMFFLSLFIDTHDDDDDDDGGGGSSGDDRSAPTAENPFGKLK